MSNKKHVDLECRYLMINQRPLCVWGTNIDKSNKDFIDSIDPDYFDYLRSIHSQAFDRDEIVDLDVQSQYAALSLRTAYSQSLETLFSLMFSTIQSPYCVPAWMNSYKNNELKNLVEKVHQGQEPILSIHGSEKLSWSAIYDRFFPVDPATKDDFSSETREGFIKTWSYFADDFLNESFNLEFNCIKHGLRVRPGGFKLLFGFTQDGDSLPPEEMMELSNSDFGLSYLKLHSINKNHAQIKYEHRNWNPKSLMWGLDFSAISIYNFRLVLQVMNGYTNSLSVPLKCPIDTSDFYHRESKSRITFSDICTPSKLTDSLTKEKIDSMYKRGEYIDIFRLEIEDSE